MSFSVRTSLRVDPRSSFDELDYLGAYVSPRHETSLNTPEDNIFVLEDNRFFSSRLENSI